MIAGHVNGAELNFGAWYAVESGSAGSTVTATSLGDLTSHIFSGSGAGIIIVPYGAGGVTSAASGKVSFISVAPEGFGDSIERVFGGFEALIEIDPIGQFTMASGGVGGVIAIPESGPLVGFGSTPSITVDPFGFSLIGAGSSSDVVVDAESANFTPGGADAIVTVDLESGKAVKTGSIGSVEVSTQTGIGASTVPETAIVTVTSVADGAAEGGSETAVEVSTEQFGKIFAGKQSRVVVDPLAIGTPVIGSLSLVEASSQSGGYPVGRKTSNVDVTAQVGFGVSDGTGAIVSVDPKSPTPLVSSQVATTFVNALTEGSGFLTGYALALVEVDALSTFGVIHSDLLAPESRRVKVPPRMRKAVFTGDDGSLKMLAEFEKQPREVVDYDFDFRDWFAENRDGDFIQAIEIAEVSPAGDLQIGSDRTPDYLIFDDPAHQIKVWASGGVSGREYKVSIVFRTNIGRTEEFDFLVFVEDI